MTKFPTCKVHLGCENLEVLHTGSCLQHTTVWAPQGERVPGPPAALVPDPIPVASVAVLVPVPTAMVGPAEPDVLDVAYHQLGVKPLPAVFPPGRGVLGAAVQHAAAFTAATQTAAEAAQGLAEAAALPELEPAPLSHRGWLRRWLRDVS